MTCTNLLWQFWVAQLDRPLFDISAELRVVERQFVHVPEQPAECDPVIRWKVPPELRILIIVREPSNRVADVFPRHTFPTQLWAHGFKSPLAGLAPVNFTALGVELPAVFGDQPNTD